MGKTEKTRKERKGDMERVSGIEPPSRAWQARVIAIIRHPQKKRTLIFVCRGSELNRRPLLFQRSALPLSYRGFFLLVDGAGLEPATSSM